jgi:hypothetical protein
MRRDPVLILAAPGAALPPDPPAPARPPATPDPIATEAAGDPVAHLVSRRLAGSRP